MNKKRCKLHENLIQNKERITSFQFIPVPSQQLTTVRPHFNPSLFLVAIHVSIGNYSVEWDVLLISRLRAGPINAWLARPARANTPNSKPMPS